MQCDVQAFHLCRRSNLILTKSDLGSVAPMTVMGRRSNMILTKSGLDEPIRLTLHHLCRVHVQYVFLLEAE
jgi:hypothetical protein